MAAKHTQSPGDLLFGKLEAGAAWGTALREARSGGCVGTALREARSRGCVEGTAGRRGPGGPEGGPGYGDILQLKGEQSRMCSRVRESKAEMPQRLAGTLVE